LLAALLAPAAGGGYSLLLVDLVPGLHDRLALGRGDLAAVDVADDVGLAGAHACCDAGEEIGGEVADRGVAVTVPAISRTYFAASWGSTRRAWSAAMNSVSRSSGSPALVIPPWVSPTPDWFTLGTRPE
jgi:hypothetical protein